MSKNLVPKNYIQVILTFTYHWSIANANVIGSPIIVEGNYTLANLQSNHVLLSAIFQKIIAFQNEIKNYSTSIHIQTKTLKLRMTQFNQAVRGLYPASIYTKNLATIPSIRDSGDKWKRAMDKTGAIWARINTEAAPFTLSGYTLAQFQAEAGALRATTAAWQERQRAARLAIEEREQLWKAIVPRLVAYRRMVAGRFEAGSWVISSLPKLY